MLDSGIAVIATLAIASAIALVAHFSSNTAGEPINALTVLPSFNTATPKVLLHCIHFTQCPALFPVECRDMVRFLALPFEGKNTQTGLPGTAAPGTS